MGVVLGGWMWICEDSTDKCEWIWSKCIYTCAKFSENLYKYSIKTKAFSDIPGNSSSIYSLPNSIISVIC